MFKSKTLFIVGAGASQEANLPTGTQLRDMIAKKLDLTFNQSSPSSRGDPEIARELRNYARQTNTDATTYFREAGRIRDAVTLLDPSAIYALAAPSTPETARKEVLSRLKEGQKAGAPYR